MLNINIGIWKSWVGVLAMMVTHASIAESITYYHNDISGSPLAATDNKGNVLWKESYKPYGEKIDQWAPRGSNKIGFHGKAFDDDTGLSYMGARYYDPTLGRFMGVDPIDFQEDNLHSFNRYTYANNNPYKYVDPTGEYAFLIQPMITAFTLLTTSAFVSSMVKGFGKGTIDGTGEAGLGNLGGSINLPGAGLDPTTQLNNGKAYNEDATSGKDADKNSSGEALYPDNPDKSGDSVFDRVHGGRGAFENAGDGSIWERDRSQHGTRSGDADQWKRWPDRRSWENGKKPNSIWPDGRVRK